MPFDKNLMISLITYAENLNSSTDIPVASLIYNYKNNERFYFHNQSYELCDPTAHAEILGIRALCKRFKTNFLTNCDIYITLEPCDMCAKAISIARFRRLYFGAYSEKWGGVDHGSWIFSSKTCLYKPEIIGGIESSRCEKILQNYFLQLREKKEISL